MLRFFSSVKETGEDEASGVCLSEMRLSSGGGFFNPGSNNNSQSFTTPIPSVRRTFLKGFSFSGLFFSVIAGNLFSSK